MVKELEMGLFSKKFLRSLTLSVLFLGALGGAGKGLASVDEDQLGAWYMYFFNLKFSDSRFGMQGDFQYRNWDRFGDLEQLLLRAGLTFSPEEWSNVVLTLGYGDITNGEFDSSRLGSRESRIYQEALLSQRVARRLRLRHRFRLEQRWVEGQDFRSRFRYAFFADVPINDIEFNEGTFYLAFYNELFINLEKDIGSGLEVDYFDRSRTYGALGYVLSPSLRVQGGYMYQATDAVQKGQLQLSLHHSIRW